jgi:ribosomal protein S16
VLARDPRRAEARLYLALVELEQHEDARAIEQLETLRPLIRHPRIAAAVDRAIAATREGCSETSRRLIAASLDDAVEWARDVREANERASAYALEPYWTIYRDRYYEPLP